MALTASAFFSGAADQISPAAEDAFFSSLRVRNRNFKKTGVGRLVALDDAVVARLSKTGRRINEVLDVGISSGITTVELYQKLVEAGQSPKLLGTDVSLHGSIVELMPHCRALVDDAGDVLQYEFMGCALRPWYRRLDFVTGMVFVLGAVNRAFAPRARQLLQTPGARVRRITLLSRRALDNPNLTAIEDDLLVPNAQFRRRFDFIRVANVLNKDHFEPAALRQGVRNVVSYLASPGALLLVVRTDKRTDELAVHQGTLFEVGPDGHRLIAVQRFGAGSEIEELLLEVDLQAAA